MREFVSFSHLMYCTGKMLPTIEWQPGVKGVVAVSCAQNADFELRTTEAGKVQTGYVSLWSFSDPIHPQYVLEAPGGVFASASPDPAGTTPSSAGCRAGRWSSWNLAEAKQQWREARRRRRHLSLLSHQLSLLETRPSTDCTTPQPPLSFPTAGARARRRV